MYDEKKHFQSLYRSIDPECSFDKRGDLTFHEWQIIFRKRLKQALGLEKMETDFAGYIPEFRLLKVQERPDYCLEWWIITPEPWVELPFYILRPKVNDRRLPLIITPHGHNRPGLYVGEVKSLKEKISILEGDRDIAIQAVKQQYLVIAPTARGFGETRFERDRKKRKLSSCRNLLVQDLLVGRTPIGDRVWDISRLLDWAIQSQNIDARLIAITGNSGGGTISLFAAACDTRIQVAVPSSYFCTFSGSIGSINHCECNYVPGLLKLGEMYDVAGLIAPRPFCAIAGRLDEIFPIQETQYAFEKLKERYTAAGVPDHCSLAIGEGGHRYYKDLAWNFIQKHFDQIRNNGQ